VTGHIFREGDEKQRVLSSGRRFGGMCRLHLQGRKISQVRNQRKAGGKQQLTFNGLHAVIYQKAELFMNTAVRTSNPTRNENCFGDQGFMNGGDEKYFRNHVVNENILVKRSS
jgi:hypothetical protein